MAYTTTNTYRPEAYPDNVPEQMGKRAGVLSTAAHLLSLRELATAATQTGSENPVINVDMSTTHQVVNEGPVFNSTMSEAEKREKIDNLQTFTIADPTSQDDYLNAIAPDAPAIPVTDQAAAARAALSDIFGGNN
ncbi:MAG TPA: hypothetical protein VM124_02620 [Candidatus Limnocylindrales bacterium]|nr:hypothetical protein [Candidatus Limnocylindrales bacterium]